MPNKPYFSTLSFALKSGFLLNSYYVSQYSGLFNRTLQLKEKIKQHFARYLSNNFSLLFRCVLLVLKYEVSYDFTNYLLRFFFVRLSTLRYHNLL